MVDDELDDDSPMWLINEQIKGLLEGDGAGEDHESVCKFLLSTGLPKSTVDRMHRAIVFGDVKMSRNAWAAIEAAERKAADLKDADPPAEEGWTCDRCGVEIDHLGFCADCESKNKQSEEEDDTCYTCRGTGEGRYDGAACVVCGGKGVKKPAKNSDDY